MSAYLNERSTVVLNNKQNLLFLSYVSLIYLIFINIQVVGFIPENLVDITPTYFEYGLSKLVFYIFVFYLILGLLLDIGEIELSDISKWRKRFWVILIFMSFFEAFAVGTILKNPIIVGIQYAIFPVFIFYLCEKTWETGFDFGIELLLAINAAYILFLDLFNPGKTFLGVFKGRFFNLIEKLLYSSVGLEAVIQLLLPVLVLAVTIIMLVHVSKKDRKNSTHLSVLSAFIPVYFCLYATSLILNQINMVKSFSFNKEPSVNIVKSIQGVINPLNGFHLLEPEMLLEVSVFLLASYALLKFYSRIYTRFWLRIILKKHCSKEDEQYFSRIALTVWVIPVLGLFLGIDLPYASGLLVFAGIFYILYEQFKNDEEAKKYLFVGVIGVCVSSLLFSYFIDALINFSTFYYTAFVLLLIAITGWYTSGPYNIFKKIRDHGRN